MDKKRMEEMIKEIQKVEKEKNKIGLVKVEHEFVATPEGFTTIGNLARTEVFELAVEASDYELEDIIDEFDVILNEKLNPFREEIERIIQKVNDNVDREKYEKIQNEWLEKKRKEVKEKEELIHDSLKEMLKRPNIDRK